MHLYHYAVIATTALLPAYMLRFDIWGLPTNLLEILIGLSFLLTVKEWKHLEFKELKRYTWPLVFIALFLLASILSVVVSPHLYTSLGILKSWILLPILFGFSVFMAVQSRTARYYVRQALIVSGTVVSLFAISQVGTVDRISGIYDVPNSLALYIAPILLLAALSKERVNKYFAAVMGAALLLTQSLSGIIAVLSVLLIATFFLSGAKNAKRYGAALFFVALISASFLGMTGRIQYFMQEGVTTSLSVRQQLWSVSVDLIKDSPFLGIGLGTFEPAYQVKLHERFQAYEKNEIYNKPIPEFVFRDPHNWVLSFWLNTGFLGLVSFATLNVWFFYVAFKNKRKLQREEKAFVLALLVILLFGLTDTIYWKNDLAVLFWALVSLWCGNWRR